MNYTKYNIDLKIKLFAFKPIKLHVPAISNTVTKRAIQGRWTKWNKWTTWTTWITWITWINKPFWLVELYEHCEPY